jgi:hypothetical protein
MARPPTPIGSYGKITTLPIAGGQFEARCRFRDFDGVTRLVGRQGRTKAALRERQGRGGAQINSDTRLSVVGNAWLAEIKADENMATGAARGFARMARLFSDRSVMSLP